MFDKSTPGTCADCLNGDLCLCLQKLQVKLKEMECELRSLRQAAQGQERTIQGLTESIGTKDSEVCVCIHNQIQSMWDDTCSF